MKNPKNRFKQALEKSRTQVGLWCTIPGGYAAEAVATCGFDFLLFDNEHSPIDPATMVAQLQAVAAYEVSAVARPAANDPVLIKRLLDVGVQSLIVPYVQNPEEAQRAVDSVRYPPRGIRGVAGTTRATRFGAISDYVARADEEIALVLQIETQASLDHIEAMAAIDGVDGLFIGPNDLAASMGLPGQPNHPDIRHAIENAVRRIAAAGKPAGILSADREFVRHLTGLGLGFAAIGLDVSLLVNGARSAREAFATGS